MYTSFERYGHRLTFVRFVDESFNDALAKGWSCRLIYENDAIYKDIPCVVASNEHGNTDYYLVEALELRCDHTNDNGIGKLSFSHV